MPGSIKAGRSGDRVIELLMPFNDLPSGQLVEEIRIGPITLGHTLRWKEAKYKDWFELMVETSVINNKPADPDTFRQLRYPDADRVIENFIEILPQDIKAAVMGGMWPTKTQNNVAGNGQMPEIPPADYEGSASESGQVDQMDING